jgi:hypothetical protein
MQVEHESGRQSRPRRHERHGKADQSECVLRLHLKSSQICSTSPTSIATTELHTPMHNVEVHAYTDGFEAIFVPP